MSKKDKDVSNTSAAYKEMLPRWDLIDTVLGGTEAMRAAGKKYNPQHKEEPWDSYLSRLQRTTLFNATEKTLEHLVGQVFAEPVVPQESVPAKVKGLLEDIDLQGNDLTSFGRHVFKTGLAKGFTHILVEMPKATPRDDGQPRTLADDERDGIRPYWCHICPENVIAAYARMVNGKEVLEHVRILESETVRDGFDEVTRVRVRVLEPGTWQVWEKDGKKWAVVEEGLTGLDFIPMVTFYTNKDGLMQCKPPLTDLAELNVAHWQSSSDQRNCLTTARFPLLACSGADPVQTSPETGADVPIKIGPNNWLSTQDAQGKWYFVEHTGAALEAGRKDLEDLEKQMASYGAEFMKDKPGTQTATARSLDSAEAISPLKAYALAFKDALEQALAFTAKWMKAGDAGGEVQVKDDFNPVVGATGDLDVLNKTRVQRDISREAYLAELKRRSILSEDFDAAADKELLDNEPPLGGDLQGMFPGDGQGKGGDE